MFACCHGPRNIDNLIGVHTKKLIWVERSMPASGQKLARDVMNGRDRYFSSTKNRRFCTSAHTVTIAHERPVQK